MPTKDLVTALFTLNEDIINSELAPRLVTFLPKEQEVKSLNDYFKVEDEDEKNAKIANLDAADLFLYALSNVPQLDLRLSSFEYILNFKSRVDSNKQKLECVIISVEDVLTKSFNFIKIVELVLALGNFLNHGHLRLGDTPAFDLKSLQNVYRLKTNSNKSTLLRYIIDVAEVKYPEILTWTNDFQSVKVASQIDIRLVIDEINDIDIGWKKAQDQVSQVKQTENEQDIFLDKMNTALFEARAIIDIEISKSKKLEEDIKKKSSLFMVKKKTLPLPIFIN